MKIREEKGIQIKLQKFSSWSDLTDALHTGKIDGASELIELAMSAKTKGVDLKAVALGHRDGNVIVTNSTIESFEARKGMSVFIPPYEVEAEVGFSVEYVHKHYGGFGPLPMRSGREKSSALSTWWDATIRKSCTKKLCWMSAMCC